MTKQKASSVCERVETQNLRYKQEEAKRQEERLSKFIKLFFER